MFLLPGVFSGLEGPALSSLTESGPKWGPNCADASVRGTPAGFPTGGGGMGVTPYKRSLARRASALDHKARPDLRACGLVRGPRGEKSRT